MQYENRILAYIDILGFSEMIKETIDTKNQEAAQKKLQILYEIVIHLRNELNSAKNKRTLKQKAQVSMFSDTIVFSLPKAETSLVLTMFNILKKMQISLLEKDILMRGSVVHGKLIHTDEAILGPALINAYNVESKSAVYPRIVIDPKVTYLYIRRNNIKVKDKRIRDYSEDFVFTDDFDGTFYIDYFNEVEDYLSIGDVWSYYDKIDSLTKLGKEADDTGIRMKYLWMQEKLKEARELEMNVQERLSEKSKVTI